MKRFSIVLIAFLALTGLSGAQETGENVEKVMLASTANYPDAMISAAPANKLGVPVLLTERDQLTQSTEQALNRLNPNEVIVVGGPAVVSEDVVNNQIEANTTRLWGMTQVGTSIEVADYFWSEGSDEAVIVQYPQDSDQGYRLLGAVKNEVQDEDEPILVSKEGTLSASVISAVERLGAEEVEVYSTEAVNVTDDLESAGVQNVDLEEAEMEQLTEQVENRTKTGLRQDKSEGNQTLVIVGAANFRQAISAPSVPNSKSFVVGSSEQVTEAVELVRDTEAERIFVTGKPELARQIADRIESETNRTVDRVSGENAAEIAANFTTRNRNEWRQLQQERYGAWKQRVNSASGIRKAANRTLTRAETEINSSSPQEAQDLLEEAQKAFDNGNYFTAKQMAAKALSTENVEDYQGMGREEIQQRINEEREDFHEAAKEIRELSQEMAQELKEADSMEERLEIIQEYKREHREAINEMKEEAKENRRENTEKRNKNFRREPGDPENLGKADLKLETETNELKGEVRYTAGDPGYKKEIRVVTTGETVKFNFSMTDTGVAPQVVTEFRMEKSTRLEDGNYSVMLQFWKDGERIGSLERQVTIPSSREYEKQIGSGDKEQEESGNETENETDSSGATVTYTGSGFSPSTVTIDAGEKVTWKNQASRGMWVAVDQHPTHTQYDGTSTSEHCPDPGNSVFDQCKSGSSYSFTFEEPGTYSYHNHRFASHSGKVVVE